MEKSRSRVHHGTDTQVRRDTLLYPRSRRLHNRSRTEHRRHVRLTLGRDADLNACGTPLQANLLARTIQHRSAAVGGEAEFARYGVWLEHILGRRGRRDGLETGGTVCIWGEQ